MANYILSYDLNGPVPTHAQMDAHIRASGAPEWGRILETVWYVRSSFTTEQLFSYINRVLSANDRLIVVDARNMWMRNLLVTSESIQKSWAKAT